MTRTEKRSNTTPTGVVLTIVVTIGFVWAGFQWINRYNWPRRLTIRDRRANEITAFENLRRISQAQAEYKKTDWDHDGRKTYAMFYVHLWKSIDANNESVPVGLIDKELGFAMGLSRPLSGYYFLDLNTGAIPNNPREERVLDPEKEWAVTAVPIGYKNTGRITFLADNTGAIYAQKYYAIPYRCPHDPAAEGWKKIENLQQLKDFQSALESSRS